MISVDKLHRMIEQRDLWGHLPRGSGRSFTTLVQAIQSADVTREQDALYVFVAGSRAQAMYFHDMALGVARDLSIYSSSRMLDLSITIGKARILFTTRINLENIVRGRYLHNYFVDHNTRLHETDYKLLDSRIKKE